MSLKNMLNNTMDVYSVTPTKDGVGGDNPVTETLVANDVKCRIRNVSGQERELLGREGIVSSHVIYCKYQDISAFHVIKMGDKTFDVEFVDNWNKDNKYFKIYCQERK